MSDGSSNSIVNLGDISKPADTLITKISEAVGGIFAPYQIKRIAKAEAAAAILQTETEIEITDLHRRAKHRFMQEEAVRQENIEQVTSKALPQVEDDSNPEELENDWIINFFDKARIVSDDEMQNLWAKVLAGEANAPGSYSKRTVNFLGEISKDEAEMFQRLCDFSIGTQKEQPVIFNHRDEIYGNHGVDFKSLTHLEAIGLVRFVPDSGFNRGAAGRTHMFVYYDNEIHFEFPAEGENIINLGTVMTTAVGRELAPISGSEPVAGFLEHLCEEWSNPFRKIEAKKREPEGSSTDT